MHQEKGEMKNSLNYLRKAAACFIEHEEFMSNEDRSSLNRSFEMCYSNLRKQENMGAENESNHCVPINN